MGFALETVWLLANLRDEYKRRWIVQSWGRSLGWRAFRNFLRFFCIFACPEILTVSRAFRAAG